jgi:Ca-activated chloride channel homolog
VTFIWIHMLWLLILVPLLVTTYILIQRRRHKYSVRFSSLSLIKQVVNKNRSIRRFIPPALFLMAIISMIFSLSRPTAPLISPSQQSTVILAIDVSLSMIGTDIKPTRLQAAKSAAITFVQQEKKDVRIGVVSFSAIAVVAQAPTTDREAVISAINRLTEQPATAIGSAILASLDAIVEEPRGKAAPVSNGVLSMFDLAPALTPIPQGNYSSAAIILLSDGQSNTGPEPLEVIEQASIRNVRVYTVGMGSKAGTTIRFGRISQKVSLDEPTLKQIASRTGAKYFNAENETSLNSIYQNLGTQLVLEKKQTEMTALFSGFAALLVIIAGLLSLFWINKIS